LFAKQMKKGRAIKIHFYSNIPNEEKFEHN
jgi:hypothetical protein